MAANSWLEDIRAVHLAGIALSVLVGGFAVVYALYTDGRYYSSHVTFEVQRPGKAAVALDQECRQVDDVLGGVKPSALWGWRVLGSDRYLADAGNKIVEVANPASDPARHEYVHACLFAAGVAGKHHHAWMRANCTFCHGSPSCKTSCLQDSDDEQ